MFISNILFLYLQYDYQTDLSTNKIKHTKARFQLRGLEIRAHFVDIKYLPNTFACVNDIKKK